MGDLLLIHGGGPLKTWPLQKEFSVHSDRITRILVMHDGAERCDLMQQQVTNGLGPGKKQHHVLDAILGQSGEVHSFEKAKRSIYEGGV